MSELHASNWSQMRDMGTPCLLCHVLERVRALAADTETGLVCIPKIMVDK